MSVDIDAHTVGSIVTGIVAIGAMVRAQLSHRSVAAQLKACAELDARVRGYMEGRAVPRRKRAAK